ncbi:MAG: chorismate-binding protein, partial [Opitutales bacterium]
MQIHPSRTEFEALAAMGNTVPVYLDLTADCETPLGAYSKIRSGGPAFLFESIVGGERISRYSFLGANPRKVFRIFEDEVQITHKDGCTESHPAPEDPLSVIEEEMSEYQPVETPGMPPFNGGAVGYVGHEYIHYVEPTVEKPEDNPLELPILYYMITDSVLIFDHAHQVLRVCVNAHIEDEPGASYDRACEEIHNICEQLETQQKLGHRSLTEPAEVTVPAGNFTQPDFEAAVEKVKEYVRAGDVIQTVLSQRFEMQFAPSPVELYRALRTVNPSPYMFLLEDRDFSLVGASPEVHVRLTGNKVEIRPIAGTRHRGATEAEDLALEKDLLSDAKERAEHLMLVDLARNDIGRV